MRFVRVLALLTIPIIGSACHDGKSEREIADLQVRLSAANRELRIARSHAATFAAIAEERHKILMAERARADELQTRVDRIRIALASIDTRDYAAARLAIDSDQAPAPAETSTTTSDPTWKALEREQTDRQRAWNEQLDNTIVYLATTVVGGTTEVGTYHTSDCGNLFVAQRLSDGSSYRRYVGSGLSLRAAAERRLAPHAACSAPSYEHRYTR